MADRVYTVGQVSKFLSDMISSEYSLRRIYVRGEVSNCKYHSLGHIYFTLKDEKASIQAVMFKGNRSGLPFQLKDGQAIVVEGEVGFYDKETKINLYARRIAVDGPGEGKLHLLYEQLKLRLNEEGLFDFEKKKPIPKHPKKVGIVTAATGAAIQDICNIAKRRNPYVELILYPAKVQGEGAAATIARGIRVLDGMGLDTIIVGRGGGSIEDLWAFNEEEVARAIYEAKTPIISGTGHGGSESAHAVSGGGTGYTGHYDHHAKAYGLPEYHRSSDGKPDPVTEAKAAGAGAEAEPERAGEQAQDAAASPDRAFGSSAQQHGSEVEKCAAKARTFGEGIASRHAAKISVIPSPHGAAAGATEWAISHSKATRWIWICRKAEDILRSG